MVGNLAVPRLKGELEYHTVKIGGQFPGAARYAEDGLPQWFDQSQIAKPALIKDDLAKLAAAKWVFLGTMGDGAVTCAVFGREKVE